MSRNLSPCSAGSAEQKLLEQPEPQVADLDSLLDDLRAIISMGRGRAAAAINSEMVATYWQIGERIIREEKVVERLATDLRREFPSMRGLSRSNLHHIRAFAEAYPDELFVQQLVGQIPWGHSIYLLDTVKDPAERE